MDPIPEYCRLSFPPIEGNPFALARKTCENAVSVARDVTIDGDALANFAAGLDVEAVRNVARGHMGENCHVGPEDFPDPSEAANFAVLFGLLQFGHGFRRELHELCGRGAAKTITLGMVNLRREGLETSRLRDVTLEQVREIFGLPGNTPLDELTMQLWAVLRQAGESLEQADSPDFDSLCRRILATEEAAGAPAATLVRELANTFGAFNDQGISHNGSSVVFLKKATLAVGELRRLASRHGSPYRSFSDLDSAIAPIDNVIPAVLVFHKVLRLSDGLYSAIHTQRQPLSRGPHEAELRAAALVACERIVQATCGQFSALDLGYHLWLSGKVPEARRFARHHTKDTVYY